MDIAYLKKHNVVITGHKGYVGSWLLKGFTDEVEIKPFEQVEKASVVIHLACRVGNTAQDFINNIQLDTQVAEFCKTKQAKLVYASTNNVYPYKLNCAITDDYSYNDYYSSSKITGELLLRQFHSIPYTILRIGDVFGPGQKHGNFFKAITDAVNHKKVFTLVGAGSKIRNYIYIQDLTDLLSFFIKNPESITNNIYHAAYEQPITVAQILEKISEITDLVIEKKPATNTDIPLSEIRTLHFTPVPGFHYQFDMMRSLEEYCHTIENNFTSMVLS